MTQEGFKLSLTAVLSADAFGYANRKVLGTSVMRY